MQSKATCTIGWTWRPLMLLCGSLLWAWSGCNGPSYHLQHSEIHARPMDTYARLIVYFVTNKDCILIVHIIRFSKILSNTKLRWSFRVKCICQLIFIFVFENVKWHFGFEVERQMKFVKIHNNGQSSRPMFLAKNGHFEYIMLWDWLLPQVTQYAS